jgi:peroxiredoxin Q/BCP
LAKDKKPHNFLTLSDTNAAVSQLYGVYKEKNWLGKKFMSVNRSTFLIDKDGVIRKIWHKVNPEDHAGEVLEEVDALKLQAV